MMTSPPGSPDGVTKQRPQSAIFRPPRSNSRMSTSSKQGGSRVSDDDAKTSVKVVVRVRPPLRSTDPGFELIPQRFQKPMVHVTAPTSLAVDVPQGRKLFVFDHVFDEDITQEGIWEYLQDSVSSFVQGYNVSILAYGQSGAGKSYTMGTSGPGQQNDTRVMGIIPRAATHLFEKLSGAPSHSRTNSGLRTPTRYSMNSLQSFSGRAEKNWELKATYVEIYNEQLRDLLVPESTPPNERANVTIREDPKGRILLTGLHQVTINSVEDLLAALNFGSSIRQTDATAINAKSSRSHAVFSLNLIQKKSAPAVATNTKEKRFSVPLEAMAGSETFVTIDSKLHFVDLAGSERMKNTGASGERAKEGISINAGLASLGKVISQLSSRQAGSHVSYRDSKLTRLLQDSLGGNAITYMIACVTPAEFHLSETLNTIQYAQRARAIQSKPRIQQSTDESDKQAVIDRLKAEVAFLRQQIRNTEGSERRTGPTAERSERQNDREIELQNNLLDVQESYTALSQRHAKLIAELAHNNDTSPEGHAGTGESAGDRLKRSQANQQAIELMVLEYEKTIQSLETSLSTTRMALATTESNLLEKESKCVFTETLNQQLQQRLQKLADRESSTETYLHDLETRLAGQSSGEEKSSALVIELRKEIARLRENESNSEDYISTLEERLAESDQDMELVQREVERLEHLVERQRSLGKLDNLLYELDNIQQNGQEKGINGIHSEEKIVKEERHRSSEYLKIATETAIPEETDEDLAEDAAGTADATVAEPLEDDDDGLKEIEKSVPIITKMAAPAAALATDHEDKSSSPAQSKFVAEKLENVTQELVDLRMEHESTVTEYDLLSAKYQEALRTLAELQDAVDEAKHPVPPNALLSPVKSRPVSFLEDQRVTDLKAVEDQLQSSRSLSSELSLAGELQNSTEPLEVPLTPRTVNGDAEHVAEVERLNKLVTEHEEGMSVVSQQYAQLQAEHQETLETVEKLRSEVLRSKSAQYQPPPSPSFPPNVIRRQTSQNMINVDRAHRSLASLRNIAIEEFEQKPDTMQSVDVHISTAMHELHTRMERIHALEAENKNVKKEMETKAAMITGLTRERNSIKASGPIDISLIGQMEDQLKKSESEMQNLQAQYAAKEKQLQDELESLKSQHSTAVEAKEATEKKLLTTVAELEVATAAVETFKAQSSSNESSASEAVDTERTKHEDLVDSLKQDVEGHKTNIAKHETRISELEQQHSQAVQQLDEHTRNMEVKEQEHKEQISQLEAEIGQHKERAGQLEQEISEHKQHVDQLVQEISEHKQRAEQLEKELEETSVHKQRAEQLEKELEETSVHKQRAEQLEKELEEHKNTAKDGLQSHDKELAELRLAVDGAKTEHEGQVKELTTVHETKLNELTAQHEDKLNELAGQHEIKVNELTTQHEEKVKELGAQHEEQISSLKDQLDATHQEHNALIDRVAEALGQPVSHDDLPDHISTLVRAKEQATEMHTVLTAQNTELTKQLETHGTDRAELEKQIAEHSGKIADYQERIRSLAEDVANHEETIREKEGLIRKRDATIEAITVEKQNGARLIEELEQQIESSFDQHHNRLSVMQQQGSQALEEANKRVSILEKEVEDYKTRIEHITAARSQSPQLDPNARSNSLTSNLRKSSSVASLPSPPPAIPLPPLPSIAATANGTAPSNSSASPPQSRHTSRDISSVSQHQAQLIEDQEARIRTIEKHLHAEKQLTATLEEALVDLETQSNKVRADLETWKKKAWTAEEELQQLKKEQKTQRYSIQQVEEEQAKRREAEAARAHLEERMQALSRKKKKSGLNCF